MVIHVGISPAEYWALTLGERDALVEEMNRAKRKR